MNKILLIGGSGYIGRSLKRELNNEFEIYITGSKKIEKEKYYYIDFSKKNSFQNLKHKSFDLVIILASSIKGINLISLNNIDLRINTILMSNFLQFVNDNNLTKKIIYISSMTVYDPILNSPVEENSNLNPKSTYGLSKLLAEKIISFFSFNNNVNSLILRIPGVYGGDRKNGFIYNSIIKAMNNELIVLNTNNLYYWECIEINDLCIAIKNLIINYKWSKKNYVINIGYGKSIDIYQTLNFIIKFLKSNSKIKKINISGYKKFYLSNKRLKNIIEFKYDFKKSLIKYINLISYELRNR